MRTYTEAKKEGNRKWDAANLDRISVAIPKGRKAELQVMAKRLELSVNGLINKLIDEALEREARESHTAGSGTHGAGAGSEISGGKEKIEL